MSAHARNLFLCSLVFAPFMLAMPGCTQSPSESPKALSSRGTLDAIDREAEPITQATPSDGSDLATLAQRDVDDFLRLKREATDDSSDPEPVAFDDPADNLSQVSDTAVAAKPAEIIWTDPVGKSLSTSGMESDEMAPTTTDFVTMGAPPDEEPANDVLAMPEQSLEGKTTEERLNELLVGLSAELYMRASDADQPLRELIMISATSMVDPTRSLANIEALPGLTDRERELLSAFQAFFLKLGDKLDGSEEADAAIMTALKDLQTDIVKAPILTIPAASLCTSVEGFGKYQPFSSNRFLAHANQQMVVYVEIDDFACTQGQTGQWVTELAQQLIIYSDRDGIPVWREEWLPVVDTSSKARQDFYTTQLVTLPTALSVGKYQLKIRLRDEQSGAEAEKSIEFEMVADPKLATGH